MTKVGTSQSRDAGVILIVSHDFGLSWVRDSLTMLCKHSWLCLFSWRSFSSQESTEQTSLRYYWDHIQHYQINIYKWPSIGGLCPYVYVYPRNTRLSPSVARNRRRKLIQTRLLASNNKQLLLRRNQANRILSIANGPVHQNRQRLSYPKQPIWLLHWCLDSIVEPVCEELW